MERGKGGEENGKKNIHTQTITYSTTVSLSLRNFSVNERRVKCASGVAYGRTLVPENTSSSRPHSDKLQYRLSLLIGCEDEDEDGGGTHVHHSLD